MVKIGNRIPERGDIIQLNLNPRIGSEQSGHRPAIVISPKTYNRISRVILICPITSKEKGWPFEVKLLSELNTYGVILADQIRTIDCSARKAVFIERAPQQVINEVLGKIETLTT